MTRKKIFTIVASLSLIFNLLLLIVLFTPVCEWLYKPLVIDDSPRKSEVIVILAHSDVFDTPNGFPDFSTFARIHKGVELFRKGYAKKIICVGGSRLKSSKKSYAQVMKDALLLYGIPEESIFLQDTIPGDFNYYDNLMNIIERYDSIFDLNKSIIVTSPQNTFRIKMSFRKKNINPVMVPTEKYALRPSNWHMRFELFRDIANEYYALLLFFLLGRI